MNSEIIKGKAKELDGKIKKAVGEAFDIDQLKSQGKAAEEWGKQTVEADHLADDAQKHSQEGSIRR